MLVCPATARSRLLRVCAGPSMFAVWARWPYIPGHHSNNIWSCWQDPALRCFAVHTPLWSICFSLGLEQIHWQSAAWLDSDRQVHTLKKLGASYIPHVMCFNSVTIMKIWGRLGKYGAVCQGFWQTDFSTSIMILALINIGTCADCLHLLFSWLLVTSLLSCPLPVSCTGYGRKCWHIVFSNT